MATPKPATPIGSTIAPAIVSPIPALRKRRTRSGDSGAGGSGADVSGTSSGGGASSYFGSACSSGGCIDISSANIRVEAQDMSTAYHPASVPTQNRPPTATPPPPHNHVGETATCAFNDARAWDR